MNERVEKMLAQAQRVIALRTELALAEAQLDTLCTGRLITDSKPRVTAKPGVVVTAKQRGRQPTIPNLIDKIVALLGELGADDAPGMSLPLMAQRLQTTLGTVRSTIAHHAGHRVIRIERGLYGLPK